MRKETDACATCLYLVINNESVTKASHLDLHNNTVRGFERERSYEGGARARVQRGGAGEETRRGVDEEVDENVDGAPVGRSVGDMWRVRRTLNMKAPAKFQREI